MRVMCSHPRRFCSAGCVCGVRITVDLHVDLLVETLATVRTDERLERRVSAHVRMQVGCPGKEKTNGVLKIQYIEVTIIDFGELLYQDTNQFE